MAEQGVHSGDLGRGIREVPEAGIDDDARFFRVDAVFRFERIDVSTEEGWAQVKVLGRSGWDLISVDHGMAYLRLVLFDASVGDEEIQYFCATCSEFSFLNKKLGKCGKHGRYVGKDHVACQDYRGASD